MTEENTPVWTPMEAHGHCIHVPGCVPFRVGDCSLREFIVAACNSYGKDQKTIAALVTACKKSKGVADMGEFVDESDLRRDMLIISHLCDAAIALAGEKS